MQKVNPVIQWWHGKSLPALYIYPPEDKIPKESLKILRLYYRTWLVHPLKRRIAKCYLWILQTFFGLKVIAITGSSGKTSTKDMLTSILSLSHNTVASYLNIDSTFNIPTTILKCTPSTEYLILELGVEYKGDMDFYRWLVTPDISVITNIYQTHTLHLHNIEGVAQEKVKIIENLSSQSFVILHKENNFTDTLIRRTKAKVMLFGKGSDIEATNLNPSFEGTKFTLSIKGKNIEIRLPLIGEHFVNNSLAATTAAYLLQVSPDAIKNGLEKTIPADQRLTVKKLKNGAIILDDSYNNNPSAAKATFEAIKKVVGKRKLILVYGDMKELGETEVEKHREIGKIIESLRADFVILVGPLSKYTKESLKKTRCVLVQTTDQVPPLLRQHATANSLILVKGSRSLKLENVVSGLK